LGDTALMQIAATCAGFEVDGMRADIVMARTATALAAWAGRTSVLKEDVRQAALLALPHRRRRNPFDAPGLDEDKLDEILDGFPDEEPEPEPDPEPQGPDDDGGGPDGSPDGGDGGGDGGGVPPQGGGPETGHAPDAPQPQESPEAQPSAPQG
ncbi:magnesium chelatase, partial [Streptomyces katrae]